MSLKSSESYVIMAKKRKMSALQKRYFGKRKTRRAVSSPKRKTRVVYMARRRARGFRRVVGGLSRRGGMLGKIAPALSGVADNIIDSYSPIDGIGSAVVGFALKDGWSLSMGMYKIGYSGANMIPIPRGGSGGSSGGFN
jgi:hypothetical protein